MIYMRGGVQLSLVCKYHGDRTTTPRRDNTGALVDFANRCLTTVLAAYL